MSTPKVRSEDVLGLKVDRCTTDAIVKMGGGLLVGGTLSLLFFKRKIWPVTFFVGAGLGMAYANFQNDLKSTSTSSSHS